jgi:hypothetical protein
VPTAFSRPHAARWHRTVRGRAFNGTDNMPWADRYAVARALDIAAVVLGL